MAYQSHTGSGDNVGGNKETTNTNINVISNSNDKQQDSINILMALGVLTAIGIAIGIVFFLCPGMLSTYLITYTLDLNLDAVQMWIFSILNSFIVFYIIKKFKKSLGKAFYIHTTFSISIAIFFLIAEFGFHANFTKTFINYFLSSNKSMEILNVKTTHNVIRNKNYCMKVSFDISTRGLKNTTCNAKLQIYFKNNRNNVSLSSKKVIDNVDFIPKKNVEILTNLTIFIPYSNINAKKKDLYHKVILYSQNKEGWDNHGNSEECYFSVD